MYPDGIHYSKEHEWVSVEGDAATVGITHHAQSELGDIVFVELPDLGARVSAGAEFGTVESVKAVSELYCPVGGEVIEINETLRDAPETINQDPYGKGWIVKIRMSSPTEIGSLLDAGAYKAYVEAGGS